MSANMNPTTKELRQFGLVTGFMVAALFGVFFPWVFERAYPQWPFIVLGVMFTWAIVAPKTLKPVYHGWMKVGEVLGFINTRIILGILFYVIFMPVGLAMRLLGKDPMARKLDKTTDTYRVIHENTPAKNHVERPY